MKKTLLLASLFVGSVFTMNAQTVLFNVDFSTTDVLQDWYAINADGDNYNWSINVDGADLATDNGFVGGYAWSASYLNTAGPLFPDNGLITQAFAVPENGGGELTFVVGALDTTYYEENYSVYIIADSPIFQDEEATIGDIFALYSDATPALTEVVSTPMATLKTISLDDYAGQTVRAVFRHHGTTDVYYILLDDIAVTVTEGGASVDTALAGSFSVYPNPAKDVLNISNSIGAEINTVTVSDINGRTVKQFGSVSQINISDLNAGVYFVNISSNEGSLTKKVVKQ